MLLRGRQGTELALSIVDYQFPDEQADPWDSNWLLVSLRVVAPQGSWEVVDPCLTTWEAEHLVRWLVAVAARPPATGRVSFSEPNVSVWAALPPTAPDRAQLWACFALELRPPWLSAAAGSRDLCVDLDVTRIDLVKAAASLRSDLERFPQRGDDPTL